MPAVDDEDANPNAGRESNLKDDSKNSRDDTEVELGKRSSSAEVDASLLAHFDVLRFKNTFFEALEELRMKRVVNMETEERLQAVMTQKHELELRLDEALLKASTTAEHQAAVELEGTRHHEEQMRSIEEEKSKLMVLNEARERELKALKDEIRALHMTKYTLSKQTQEQERQLQLQCTSRETYVTLVNHLEEKCVQVTQRVTEVSELIEKVEANVKEAVRLNNNLMLANRHQGCTLAWCQQDLELCRRELQVARAQHSCSQSSEGVLSGDTSRMRSVEQELKMQIELNRQLQNQLSQLRDEHQITIQSLRDAHVLIERHTESCVKMAANEAGLQKELDSKQDKLNALEENLKASTIMCSCLEDIFNQQKQCWEEKHADVSHRLATLQSEYTTLETRYELLETSKMDIAKELADVRDSTELQQLKAALEHMHEKKASEKEGVVKLEQEMVKLQNEMKRLEGELQLEKREVLRLEGELELERRENGRPKAAGCIDMQHGGNDLTAKDVSSDSHQQLCATSDMSQEMVSNAKESCSNDLFIERSSKGEEPPELSDQSNIHGPLDPWESSTLQGPSDPQGSSSLQGPSDPQGFSRLQGPSDPQGSSSFQGPSDPQGSFSFQGPSDPQGSSSLQGPSDPQGSSSLQGPSDPQESSSLQGISDLHRMEHNILDVKCHSLPLPPPHLLPSPHSTVPPYGILAGPSGHIISEGAATQHSISTLPSLALHLHKIRLLTSRSTTSTQNTSTVISGHSSTTNSGHSSTTNSTITNTIVPSTHPTTPIVCANVNNAVMCPTISYNDAKIHLPTEPQCGDMAEPQCGDMAEPQCGDMAEPQCGDMAEPLCGDMAEPLCGDMAEPQFSLKNISPMKTNLVLSSDASYTESVTNHSISSSSISGPQESSVPAQESLCRVGLGTHSDHQLNSILQKSSFLDVDGLQSAECTSETDKNPYTTLTLGAVKRPSLDAEQFSPKKAKLEQEAATVAGTNTCASNEAIPFSSQPESVTSDGVQTSLSFPDDDNDEIQSYISKQIGKVASFLRGDRLRRPRKITEACRIKL